MFLLTIKCKNTPDNITQFYTKEIAIREAKKVCSVIPHDLQRVGNSDYYFLARCEETGLEVFVTDKKVGDVIENRNRNGYKRLWGNSYTRSMSSKTSNTMSLPRSEKDDTLYRHFKGDIYRVICKSISEEDPTDRTEDLIIYTKADGTGRIWHRQSHKFHGHKGRLKRFTKLPNISQYIKNKFVNGTRYIRTCEICGKNDTTIDRENFCTSELADPRDYDYVVKCNCCGFRGPANQSKEGAIKLWNTTMELKKG